MEDFNNWCEWEKRENDIYDQIPVPHNEPLFLKVKMIQLLFNNGKGYPTSRIVVEYPSANGKTVFRTTKKKQMQEPHWDEKFRFVLSEKPGDERLKFSLYVEDWRGISVPRREAFFSIKGIEIGGKIEEKIQFDKNTSLAVRISLRQKSYLRFSLALSDEEMQFRKKRLPKVMKSFRTALGDDGGPKNLFETPVMSLVCSGGGIRAATAMCGVMEGLEKIDLLSCMTYTFGTSGSSWYLAGAYIRKAFEKQSRRRYHTWMKNSLQTSCFWEIPKFSNIKRGVKMHKKKCKKGQPFTLVDYYGICATNKLIGKQYRTVKLSDIRPYVETGEVPYPILDTSQVQDLMDVRRYRADCSFSPHECELSQYGLSVDLKHANSDFYCGVLEQNLPEPDLSFMVGTLGSIFGLRINRMLGLDTYEEMMDHFAEFENSDSEEEDGKEIDCGSKLQTEETSTVKTFLQWLSSIPQFLDRNMFIERTGQILNIARGLNDMKRFAINPQAGDGEVVVDGFREDDEIMSLVDGGILCNVAIDAALRPQRRNDILFIVDFSYYEKDVAFETLVSAIRLSKEGGYKFPPVDMEKIKSEEPKEFYIFEDENDPDCPLVFWLIMSTAKFKLERDYHPKDPRVLRHLPPGKTFNDFDVFSSETYNTFNVRYSSLDFDRIRELMIYNIKINEEAIKDRIRDRIQRRKDICSKRRDRLGDSN